MKNENLVYIGQIISLEPIQGADFIVSATVFCGVGGKWIGIVRKDEFEVGNICVVYLPDSVIPECIGLKFMYKTNWRVKMMRFKGSPSEVLITPCNGLEMKIGTDITNILGVTKYIKEIPASLAGIAKGDFPSFIPKTDEPNWQRVPELIENLKFKRYYITEKLDGSSTTAYKWRENFGVCSRNLELEEDLENGYWKVARKYNLKKLLPEGYAIQWETCGPKIQKNQMGLKEIDGFAFSVYDIASHNYLDGYHFLRFCEDIDFPTCRVLKLKDDYQENDLTELARGTYENGKLREGIVIRSWNHIENQMISFKVINLDYET